MERMNQDLEEASEWELKVKASLEASKEVAASQRLLDEDRLASETEPEKDLRRQAAWRAMEAIHRRKLAREVVPRHPYS